MADENKDGITSTDEAYGGDAITILNSHRVPWIDDTEDGSRGSGLMNHKFVVIDQSVVISGSANFTASGLHGDANGPKTRGNVNHLLRIESHDLTTIFRTEFMQLWGDGPGGAKNSQFGLKKNSRGASVVDVGDDRVEVLFPPHRKRDANNRLKWINAHLSRAQQTIDLALFVFSAQSLANILQE